MKGLYVHKGGMPMGFIKLIVVLLVIIIGVITVCFHVDFDNRRYDLFLTLRWNEKFQIAINYKEGLECQVFGEDSLMANANARIQKQLKDF
jgi:hypothetical protein